MVSLAMLVAGPRPTRFDPQVIRMAQAERDFSPERERCHDSSSHGSRACVLGARAEPSAMLWGDSHGVEFAYILSQMEAEGGRSLIQRTQSSCPPLIGYDPPDDPRCGRANREAFEAIRSNKQLRTIYLAGFWGAPRYPIQAVRDGLNRTIDTLIRSGRHVVLIGPVPSAPYDVPRRLAHLAQFGGLDRDRGFLRDPTRAFSERIGRIAVQWRGGAFTYVDPATVLCGKQWCATRHDSAPLYFDSHHPSLAGARLILAPLAMTR
jgi:hypothetical protein